MSARPLSVTLIGTWELLSREDRTSARERRIDPSLGADPVALLYYDRAGHFAAQFMKRDRSGTAPVAAGGGANNPRSVGGYDAYFGDYTVDDASGLVTQTLRGAIAPESVGMVVTRGMVVDGDRLTIRLDTTSAEGVPVVRTLVWRRVG